VQSFTYLFSALTIAPAHIKALITWVVGFISSGENKYSNQYKKKKNRTVRQLNHLYMSIEACPVERRVLFQVCRINILHLI
jgi:hypothetical protein